MNHKYVILDAGHGINTAGKRSPFFNDKKDYMLEFEFNLSVIIMLYKLLVDKNIKVDFTSTSIMDIDLKDRIFNVNNIVNRYKGTHNPILISIHANAFGDGKTFNEADGIEILYNPNKADNLKLAQCMHDETKMIVDMSPRGLKPRSNLALLKNTNLPSCIIEGGFMTNKYDLNFLMDYNYKSELARAIFNGIEKYYKL